MINSFAMKANQKIINNILIRNHILRGKIADNDGLGSYSRSKNLNYKSIKFRNAPQFDLSKRKMSYMLISGVNFQRANFNYSDLRHTIFSHVNLKGASFIRTNLAHTVWVNTICPDGSLSSSHNNSCLKNIFHSAKKKAK